MKKSKRDITTLEAVLIVIVVILLTTTIWFASAWKSPQTRDSNIQIEVGEGETIEEAEQNKKPIN